MTWYEYMIYAAQRSRFDAKHWFRYLCKVIFEDHTYLTDEDVERLLQSEELTKFQKVSLKYAVIPHTPTNEYVISLNKPAKLVYVDKLKENYPWEETKEDLKKKESLKKMGEIQQQIFNDGKEEGLVEGREEGLTTGLIQGAIKMRDMMIEMTIPSEEIKKRLEKDYSPEIVQEVLSQVNLAF